MRGSYVYYAVEIEREEGSSSLSKLDLEGEEEREGVMAHHMCECWGKYEREGDFFLHLRLFPPPPPSP